MRKIHLLLFLCSTILLSCQDDEQINQPLQPSVVSVQFSVPALSNGSGRTQSSVPKAVLVTILKSDNSVLLTRKEIPIYRVGSQYLSLPLSFDVPDGSKSFKLNEFLVVDGDNNVTHLTPKEGSMLEHLVADPVDILFTVNENAVTMVEPEVIAIEEESTPADYGYSQFKMTMVETVHARFLPNIKENGVPVFGTMKVKVVGTLANGTSWRYEKDLLPEANLLTLRKAASYKITATKAGFEPFEVTRTIAENDEVSILLEPQTELPTILSMSPISARPGMLIKVHGHHLGNRREDFQVIAIGPYNCTITRWISSEEIEILINPYSGPGNAPVGLFPVSGSIAQKPIIAGQLFEILPPPGGGN